MTDRRPPNPEYVTELSDLVSAALLGYADLLRDPVAAVRAAVESGTIKGEVVEWCRVHRGNPRDCEHKAVYDEVCDVTQALVVESEDR